MRALALTAVALLAACGPPPPIPLPAPSGEATAPALRPLETELRGIIGTEAPHDSLEVAVALIDLETGDSLLIDARTRMHAASTMKVPVMLELFRRARAGELSLDEPIEVRNSFTSIADGSRYSLSPEDDSDAELYQRIGERVPMRELIDRMIARSSNLATNLLIELADPARIAATLREIGASDMHVLRGVEDIPAFERGMNNTTTAYGFLKALQAVAREEPEMVRILEGQEFREMIPAGLPEGTRVGNKTGWITGINHDGAIVYPPGRAPYVLVVLTRGFRDPEAAHRVGRRISRRVWLYLTDGATASIASPSRTRARPLFTDSRVSSPPLAVRTWRSTREARVSAGFQVAVRRSAESLTGSASGTVDRVRGTVPV